MLELILEHKAGLCNEIRKYVKSQLDLWQQVPWLALHADGNDGAMGHSQYAAAYLSGSWALMTNQQTPYYYCPFIDCATGKIRIVKNSIHASATDDDLIPILLKPELINAEAIIAELQLRASAPRPKWISREEARKRMAYRQRVIENFGLSPQYCREKIAA